MSAGYLWRAALDGEVPQKVLAGVPSELRAELGQTPFSSLSLIRPPSAHDAAPVGGTAGAPAPLDASSQTPSAPGAARVTLVAFAPPTARRSHRGSHSASRSKARGGGKGKAKSPAAEATASSAACAAGEPATATCSASAAARAAAGASAAATSSAAVPQGDPSWEGQGRQEPRAHGLRLGPQQEASPWPGRRPQTGRGARERLEEAGRAGQRPRPEPGPGEQPGERRRSRKRPRRGQRKRKRPWQRRWPWSRPLISPRRFRVVTARCRARATRPGRRFPDPPARRAAAWVTLG